MSIAQPGRFATKRQRRIITVRARLVHKTCPRCGARFGWFEPLPVEPQPGPWWRRYFNPTLVCKSCRALLHMHVRPAAWMALIGVLAALAAAGEQVDPSFGENWPPLLVYLIGGALLGLIFGLIGRWGTAYELSNEP